LEILARSGKGYPEEIYAGVPLRPTSVSVGPAPFRISGWSYEIKFDGWRALALIVKGRVRLVSRNGKELLPWFPELPTTAETVQGDALLDGEIMAGDGTLASFGKPLSRSAVRTFVAFDILASAGAAVIDHPIESRRRLLDAVARESDRIVLSRPFDDGAALYAEAVARGYEGVVGKHAGSQYHPGQRSREWVKSRARTRTRLSDNGLNASSPDAHLRLGLQLLVAALSAANGEVVWSAAGASSSQRFRSYVVLICARGPTTGELRPMRRRPGLLGLRQCDFRETTSILIRGRAPYESSRKEVTSRRIALSSRESRLK
jgi:bifunctional non-homologous end joining protein LigD